ncbi:hypothetical protein CPC08DRAFT_636341 [Agrocybe pediades]|nr:hypothetical protein CPC08DRAFT_636341 [Agrocybe pediades]
MLQGADPNTPEMFKNNIQMVHQQVIEIQKLARRVLGSIQNAYQYGNSPVHTEADITTLKQMIFNVTEKLRASGVGALPVLPQAMTLQDGTTQMQPPLREEQLGASITANLRVLYEQLQKSQEGASMAASLMTTDHSARANAPK